MGDPGGTGPRPGAFRDGSGRGRRRHCGGSPGRAVASSGGWSPSTAPPAPGGRRRCPTTCRPPRPCTRSPGRGTPVPPGTARRPARAAAVPPWTAHPPARAAVAPLTGGGWAALRPVPSRPLATGAGLCRGGREPGHQGWPAGSAAHRQGDHRLAGTAGEMAGRGVWGCHGDLDEQCAANKHVDHAPDNGRGQRERDPPSQPPRQPGQRGERPQRQDEQEVAHDRLGEQGHQGECGQNRVGPRVAEVLQRADQRRRRAHLAHEQPLDQQQAGRHPRDRCQPPAPRPRLARPGPMHRFIPPLSFEYAC
jgi:hypothetical protein